MPEASTELAVIAGGDTSPYELLRMTQQDLDELLGEALAPGEKLGARDLTTLAWPGAGATTWEIPGPSGIEPAKAITGVILSVQTTRGYWKAKWEGESGEDARPDCSSMDGITGEGEPGGACESCPFNEFGTAIDEKGDFAAGKACKERRVLFVLPRDGILPYVISAPPGSLDSIKSYRIGLLNQRLNVQKVETELTLEKAENAGGIKFARLVPRKVGILSDEAIAGVRAFQQLVAPTMRRAAADAAQDRAA